MGTYTHRDPRLDQYLGKTVTIKFYSMDTATGKLSYLDKGSFCAGYYKLEGRSARPTLFRKSHVISVVRAEEGVE